MPIRMARSERTARSCVGVRQRLAVDAEVEIVAAVADPHAKQLLDSGAITQAEFDAIRPRRSRSAQRS